MILCDILVFLYFTACTSTVAVLGALRDDPATIADEKALGHTKAIVLCMAFRLLRCFWLAPLGRVTKRIE